MHEIHPDLSPYIYCAGKPIGYIDPDGCDSIAVLKAPRGAGGAGHMAALVQGEDKKWYLYSKNGTEEHHGIYGRNRRDGDPGRKNDVGTGKPNTDVITGYDSVEQFMSCNTNNPQEAEHDNKREYSEAYVIDTGDPTNNRKAEVAMKKVLEKDYNVVSSNCAQTVQSGLKAAGKKDGSLDKGVYMNPHTGGLSTLIIDLTPNLIYGRIKKSNPNGRIVKSKD